MSLEIPPPNNIKLPDEESLTTEISRAEQVNFVKQLLSLQQIAETSTIAMKLKTLNVSEQPRDEDKLYRDIEAELAFAMPHRWPARVGTRMGFCGPVSTMNGAEYVTNVLRDGTYIEGTISGAKYGLMPELTRDKTKKQPPPKVLPSALVCLRDVIYIRTDDSGKVISVEPYKGEVQIPLCYEDQLSVYLLQRYPDREMRTVKLGAAVVDTYRGLFDDSGIELEAPGDRAEEELFIPEGLPLSAEEPRRLMRAMQAVVLDFMGRLGKAANDMTVEEVREFSKRVAAQAAFETYKSDTMAEGNILVATDAGGFCAISSEGDAKWQPMADGDMLMGELAKINITRVPARQCMLDAIGHKKFAITDTTMSATVILEGARYYSGKQSDGEYAQEVDLTEKYSFVQLPAAYDMPVQVIDVNQLPSSD